MLFGIDFPIAPDSLFLHQKTAYHIFGKSDSMAQLFHSQHLFEHRKPFMGFFKQYVQSGYFLVFGFKLLIVYSLKITYLFAVLLLHMLHLNF